MAISRHPQLRATALSLLLAACGHAATTAKPAPAPETPVRVLPLDQLYVLEMAGIPAEDTIVTFATGAARIIVVRHGAPDNTTFAELRFPADAWRGEGVPDSVRVTIHPRPGLYGLDVALSADAPRGATLRFKYPVHFSAPVAGLRKYGGVARYEQALAVARAVSPTTFGLLQSNRPASDNLEAALPGGGTYLVAAPR